jgi:hypothetical protein
VLRGKLPTPSPPRNPPPPRRQATGYADVRRARELWLLDYPRVRRGNPASFRQAERAAETPCKWTARRPARRRKDTRCGPRCPHGFSRAYPARARLLPRLLRNVRTVRANRRNVTNRTEARGLPLRRLRRRVRQSEEARMHSSVARIVSNPRRSSRADGRRAHLGVGIDYFLAAAITRCRAANPRRVIVRPRLAVVRGLAHFPFA